MEVPPLSGDGNGKKYEASPASYALNSHKINCRNRYNRCFRNDTISVVNVCMRRKVEVKGDIETNSLTVSS